MAASASAVFRADIWTDGSPSDKALHNKPGKPVLGCIASRHLGVIVTEQISFSARVVPDRPDPEIVVDAGLELALAMYDVFLVDCGRDFADLVRESFEARLERRRRDGGVEAEAANAASAVFAGFDWYREVLSQPSARSGMTSA